MHEHPLAPCADTPADAELSEAVAAQHEHVARLAEIETTINEAIGEVNDEATNPVVVHSRPQERVHVPDLIDTEHELYDKVVKVLAYLVDEIAELKAQAEARFYAPLALFGTKAAPEDGSAGAGDDGDPEMKDGELELEMGRHLPFFQEIANFADRCKAVTINLVHQVAALYSGKEQLYTQIYKKVQLVPVFEALGDLFQVLITIDYIIADNMNIADAWDKYKSAGAIVKSDPEKYGMDASKVDDFYRLLVTLDAAVLGGTGVFEACVEQDFEVPDPDTGSLHAVVRGNAIFMNELLARASSSCDSLTSVIGTGMETREKEQLVGIFGLYVLHRKLMPPSQLPDKKLYARFWATQEPVPIVTLYGKVTWTADQFLLRYAKFPAKKLVPKDPEANRAEWTRRISDAFARSVASVHMSLASWLVQMDMHFARAVPAKPSVDLLRVRGTLLVEGLVLAHQASHVLKGFMNLHLATGSPVRKRNIEPLAQAVELLKVIEAEFQRKSTVIAESVPHLLRGLSHDIIATFRPVKAKLMSASGLDPARQETLAAITLLENVLQSTESFTATRRTVVALALRVALMKGSAAAGEAVSLGKKTWMMGMLADWQTRILSACDCSFLYWHRELLPNLLESVFVDPERAQRLRYLVAGFGDAGALLSTMRSAPAGLFDGSGLTPGGEDLSGSYKRYILDCIDEEVIRPTCQRVEKDLRLQVHAVHLSSVDAPNPKAEGADVPVGKILAMAPLRVLDDMVDIRKSVAHYLERTFYNLTTVALHDWKTYGEMASLAEEKYGLKLVDNHLPMGSLDQGLDILAIMRNIHIFVRRYNYNLNQQFFVEKRPDRGAKHLNSVNIESIAASIRTHGTGMMSTTVNFVYQFLRTKFNIFSQFLYDDYIKSHLGRERRWYKRNQGTTEVDNKYPYARAFEFTRDIRKLGVENNLSFLDKFRLLITQIGNALGYVRMVRSAGMHQCANAVKFVPDLKDVIEFAKFAGEEGGVVEGATGDDASDAGDDPPAAGAGAEGGATGGGAASDDEDAGGDKGRVKGAGLSEETVAACEKLDNVIKNLMDNFAEGADYLKVLVEAFQEKMLSEEQAHLKNFVMIVPSLTINFVETIMFAKDRMEKSVKGREAYFTDDGFAIGVAYILAIMKQGAAFESLHWFDCVKHKYAADKRSFDMQLSSIPRKKGSEEQIEELRFKQKRSDANIREFSSLYYSLSGAQIFFKDE